MKRVLIGCAITLFSFTVKASGGKRPDLYPEGTAFTHCSGVLQKYGKSTKVELTIFRHMPFSSAVGNIWENMISVLMSFPDEKRETTRIIRAHLQTDPTEIVNFFMDSPFLRIYRANPEITRYSNFDTLEYTPGDEQSSIIGQIICGNM